MPKRVGIVGYGHLGQYLTEAIHGHPQLELAFVWNRSPGVVEANVESRYICRDLAQCHEYSPDLIVEVAHPDITKKYGSIFLETADFLVGSPTALADPALEKQLRDASATSNHGLYIPAGAFWGGEDIKRMADRGTLKALKVTMRKHPSSLKLEGQLKQKNASVADQPVVLYDGPVRNLCPLAPNNVNTMAAAAMIAPDLGFDGVIGSIVSDPSLLDWHIVEVDVTGQAVNGRSFNTTTIRRNPAEPGAVTGTATYASFLSSMLAAGGKEGGVHLC